MEDSPDYDVIGRSDVTVKKEALLPKFNLSLQILVPLNSIFVKKYSIRQKINQMPGLITFTTIDNACIYVFVHKIL